MEPTVTVAHEIWVEDALWHTYSDQTLAQHIFDDYREKGIKVEWRIKTITMTVAQTYTPPTEES